MKFKIYNNYLISSEIYSFMDILLRHKQIQFISNLKIKYRLVLLLKWFYLPTKTYDIKANIGLIKPNYDILIDKKSKKVTKISKSNIGNELLESEVNYLTIINQFIISKQQVVKVPKLLNHYKIKENLFVFEEEYFEGNEVWNLSKSDLEIVNDSIYNFMIDFYFFNNLKLVLFNEKEIKHNVFNDNIDFKKEVILIYNRILNQRKKMLYGTIHGDLRENNILIDLKKNICLIDFEKTCEDYLVLEIRKEEYYTKIINRLEEDKGTIYSFKEQLFLTEYLRVYRSVILKSNKVMQDQNWVDRKFNNLYKLGINLI